MARYKKYDYSQGKFIPINFDKQILPGTFEHTLHYLKKTKPTTDSGFHSEKNVEMVIQGGIDAYIADNKFRHRDPRFADADRYKERFNKEIAKKFDRSIIFQPRDFTVSPDKSFCICPAGKRMYKSGSNIQNGKHTIRYRGTKRDCIPCQVRAKCMKNPDVTEIRQFAHFTGQTDQQTKTFTQKMREKIDSVAGKLIYGRRLVTVEPVFANIRSSLGLDRFSLRGKKKVSIQTVAFALFGASTLNRAIGVITS